MLSPEGGGGAIVVIVIIVALVVLVVLGRRGVFSADYRRNAPHDASVIGDPEHSTCGGGAGASCGDTRQICRGYDRLRFPADHHRNAPHDASVIGDPEG